MTIDYGKFASLKIFMEFLNIKNYTKGFSFDLGLAFFVISKVILTHINSVKGPACIIFDFIGFQKMKMILKNNGYQD